jgi:leader peptidase (prepilin peptidase)/N-methyltransferase
MTPHEILFAGFAFVLGACIGSFLNVCIYRMPLNLSVNDPKRSFCPGCKYQIPWHRNLPLISWLMLRGKCANCGTRISLRYFGVELLTGLLFLGIWLHFWPQQWILALPLWILMSLLVVATFIDFDHLIIPDEITWGGAAAGIVLSFAIPIMHGVRSPLEGGLWGLAGAASGFAVLFLIVRAGKLAFGRKRIVFGEAKPFAWVRTGDTATLETDGEKEPWDEFFPDEKAVMRMQCESVEIGGETFGRVEIASHYERLTVGGKEFDLNRIETFSGKVREVYFERDAMGFGDVKFMACIGAFLGWKGALFAVVAGAMVGAVVGGISILLRHREWSAKIPFGPYLSLGAILWVFAGPQWIDWYVNLLQR